VREVERHLLLDDVRQLGLVAALRRDVDELQGPPRKVLRRHGAILPIPGA
jgi:hypothetical protein